MKNTLFAGIFVLLAGTSLALFSCSDGGRDMGGGHHEDMEHEGMMERGGMEGEHGEEGAAMEKQHETMDKLSEEWMKAKGAAMGGDTEKALAEVKKMHETAGRLEEFAPHRNAGNRDEFTMKSQEFKSLVMRFMASAEKGDKVSLRRIAPEIDQACNNCHQSFR